MKRSKLSYDEWKCIKSKKIRGKNVITDFFEGYLGLIKIEQVTEPQIWEFNGEKIDVCNSGLKWLSILPENDFYCITAMLNEKNEILLWYIDMIADKGTDEDGIPYFDDLSPKEVVRRNMINNFTHYHEYSYEEALELFDECGLKCVDSHTNLPIHHFILKKK